MIKASAQNDYIKIFNIWAPKIGVPKHVKQILTDRKKLTVL